jgi:homopolymeric O-antigen transport system permease protein
MRSVSEKDRARSDLARIFTEARIWSTLGWVDIRSKYRLSSLGSLWITAAMAVLAISIGLLYGQFFNQDVSKYLPYFATGFIIWTFISATVTEASTSLIAYGNFIKGSQLPIVFHVLRVTHKQFIVFGHNILVLVGIWLFYRWGLGFYSLLSLVGLALMYVSVFATSLIVAMICTRFRDIPPLIQAVTQFLFFATPIIWDPASMRFGAFLLWANPVTSLLIVARDPFLGREVAPEIWISAFAITVVSSAAAALIYTRYRSRIAYWV